MKRTLLVLSILFLALWIGCLFYPGRTMSIHVALLVALIFFIRSIMIIPSTAYVKESQVTTAMGQPLKNQDQEYSLDGSKTAIKQIRSELNQPDVKIL